MTKNQLNIALCTLLAVGAIGTAHAAPVTYNFTATDFFRGWQTPVVPITSISGSYTLDGGTLTRIDLTIGSHTYALNEVAYEFLHAYPTYDVYVLGGIYNGVGGMTGRTNDFWLGVEVSAAGEAFRDFTYAIPSIDDSFQSLTGTLTVSPSTVPLPPSILLFGSALLSVMGVFRRRA